MRLFIAINFPHEVKTKILSKVEELKIQTPHISWVKSENLHLTLKFLGYTKEERLEEVKKGVEVAISNLESFELNILQIGYFSREPFIMLFIPS